jgi:hypothetical protein
MAVIPPFNPQDPIPNPPFNNPNADRYNLSYPTGQLVFGDFLLVDYKTGTVSIAPNPPNNGTVRQVTAAAGLATLPPGGITTTGSIGLATIPTLTPGSYTYPTIAVNNFGKLTLALNGNTPLVNLIGTLPIETPGTNPNRNVGIKLGTVAAPGAVQLIDGISSSDNTKALTSLQGYNLGFQMSYIGGTLGGQKFAGIVSTTTGNITQLTQEGQALGGLAVGSPIPLPSPTYEGAYFVLQGADATYTPPGGSPTSVVNNDRVLCIDGVWTVLLCGTRLASASSGAAGLTILATGAEVQALTEPNKSVTPGALSVMVATDTQVGFVELATDAETQAFTDNTRAVTSSNIDTLKATTTTRGLVLLSDSTNDPSVVNAPTANALKAFNDSSLDTASVAAKGDLIVGLSYQTPIILPIGPNNSQLVVDDTKVPAGGLDWTVADSLTTWPVGGIIWNLGPTEPELWLPCDGRLLNGDIAGPYYDLYDLIGTTFNTGGEAAGFFRIPDLRGMFVRGWSGATQPPVPGQTPAAPTALDPGRVYASVQQDAYRQHNHGITDPGHFHSFSLPDHRHSLPTPTHDHSKNDPGHCHAITGIANSEVVGNDAGFYDGNSQWAAPTAIGGGDKATGIKIATATSNLIVDVDPTNITQANICTTALTINNSPPTAFSPDENRPFNVALLPIIKYSNAA